MYNQNAERQRYLKNQAAEKRWKEESYAALQRVTQDQADFTDFSPALIQGTSVYNAEWELFPSLVDRANRWLQMNPDRSVIHCEMFHNIMGWTRGKDPLEHIAAADTNTCFFHATPLKSYARHRCLRLWHAKKSPSEPSEPQEIGFEQIMPEYKNEIGSLYNRKNPIFQTEQECLEAFNQKHRDEPIKGRVINMQTRDMRPKMWDTEQGKLNPDQCVWENWDYQVMFIGLFYLKGEGSITSVGKVDFVPTQKSETSNFIRADFEPYGDTMKKVNTWIEQMPPTYNITNIESIPYKVENPRDATNIDTKRIVWGIEPGHRRCVIRTIRVYYTESPDGQIIQSPRKITHRTFVPELAESYLDTPSETQRDAAKKAELWLRATGAKVVSLETVKVGYYDSQSCDPEVTYTWPGSGRTDLDVNVIRLYVDGDVVEPSPEALVPAGTPKKPKPASAVTSFCNII